MTNLIPMAGLGNRFAEAGYTLPKALIPVSGVPMIIQVIRNLPPSDKWIFVVRQEHVDTYHIDELIKKEVPHAHIIPISKTTEGQACTCLLAEHLLKRDEPLFIAACDNACLYDEKAYAKLEQDQSVDSIIWTFTKHAALRERPKAFGWVVPEHGSNRIVDMKVKIPVSEDPYHDHAVVASFYFKRAGDFIDAANLMIKENHRINNEFYVDAIPIFMKKLGKHSVFFDIDLFLVWGTPADLYAYEKLEYLCKQGLTTLLSAEEQAALPALQKFFQMH